MYLDAKTVMWERRVRVGSDVASRVSPFSSRAWTPGKCGHFSLESNISRQSNALLRARSRRSNTWCGGWRGGGVEGKGINNWGRERGGGGIAILVQVCKYPGPTQRHQSDLYL